MVKSVVFVDSVHPVLWDRLSKLGYHCIDCTQKDKESFKQLLPSAFGIVIRSRFRLDQELLKRASQLQFIARSGSGLENIDCHYCQSKGITVFSSPEGNANAVGEHALGLLLNLMNKISIGHQAILNNSWDRESHRGIELDGKCVGLIGYGHTAQAFSKKLSGFETEVLAFDKYKSGFSSALVKEVKLQEIYDKADVLSIHLPLSAECENYVNEVFLSHFKKPIYLINTARGKHLSYSALLKGLENGRILGAGLDVHAVEKSSFESLDRDPLFEKIKEFQQVLLTPHVAGWTVESYYKLSAVLADKIEKYYA